MNRSTFYLHYETIGDLLAESIEYMHIKKLLSYFSDSDNSVVNKLRFCPEEELFSCHFRISYSISDICLSAQKYLSDSNGKPEDFSLLIKPIRKCSGTYFDPILQRFFRSNV